MARNTKNLCPRRDFPVNRNDRPCRYSPKIVVPARIDRSMREWLVVRVIRWLHYFIPRSAHIKLGLIRLLHMGHKPNRKIGSIRPEPASCRQRVRMLPCYLEMLGIGGWSSSEGSSQSPANYQKFQELGLCPIPVLGSRWSESEEFSSSGCCFFDLLPYFRNRMKSEHPVVLFARQSIWFLRKTVASLAHE